MKLSQFLVIAEVFVFLLICLKILLVVYAAVLDVGSAFVVDTFLDCEFDVEAFVVVVLMDFVVPVL